MDETEFKILLQQKLCEIVDLLFHYYNPCQWHDRQCVNGQPYCCRHTAYPRDDGSPDCLFLGKEGCTVRNLGCKLWLCNEVWDKIDSQLKRTLKALEIVARIYKLSTFPREHLIKEGREYQIRDILDHFDD